MSHTFLRVPPLRPELLVLSCSGLLIRAQTNEVIVWFESSLVRSPPRSQSQTCTSTPSPVPNFPPRLERRLPRTRRCRIIGRVMEHGLKGIRTHGDVVKMLATWSRSGWCQDARETMTDRINTEQRQKHGKLMGAQRSAQKCCCAARRCRIGGDPFVPLRWRPFVDPALPCTSKRHRAARPARLHRPCELGSASCHPTPSIMYPPHRQ